MLSCPPAAVAQGASLPAETSQRPEGGGYAWETTWRGPDGARAPFHDGGGVAGASDLTPGPLVQVSGTSPFLGCTADAVGTQSGTVYLNSEVEPWIDVNRTNTSNVVGIFQQDRWSNGGARGLVAGVSLNGGTSFTLVPIPKVTVCSGGTAANGGNYQRATDPWVSFGPNGNLYQLSLSFNDVESAVHHGGLRPRSAGQQVDERRAHLE